MQPWIIEKIKEKAEKSTRKTRPQPQIPAPEPLQQIAPPTKKDGSERGIVSVDFEL